MVQKEDGGEASIIATTLAGKTIAAVCLGVIYFSIAVLFYSLVVAIYSTRDWTIAHDAPLMHYIAQRISHGAVPYRDTLDMNMPGVYLLHLLCLEVFGTGDAAFRAFDLTWLGFIWLSIAVFQRRAGVVPILVSSLLFSSSYLSFGHLCMAQRDYLMVPFLILAADAFSRFLEKESSLSAVLAGTWAGFAMMVKPVAALFLLLYLLILLGRLSRFLLLKQIIWMGIGACVCPLVILAWLASVGGLQPFVEYLVYYLLPVYPTLAAQGPVGSVTKLLGYLTLYIPILMVSFPDRNTRQMRFQVVTMSVLAAMLQVVVQGKGWAYHFIPAFAFIALASGERVHELMVRLYASFTRGTQAVGFLLFNTVLIFGTLWLHTDAFSLSKGRLEKHSQLHVEEIEDDIKSRIRPGDTVQSMGVVYGAINALYRLDVAQPTRFIYDFFLYSRKDLPYVQKLRAEFVEKIAEKKPRLIVITDEDFPSYRSGIGRIADLPELLKILDEFYFIAVDKPRYRIFQLK